MTRALPGFSTPAVSFEQPFEMLHACHERVQRSLNLLERIVAHVDAHGHDAQSRAAVADVLRYFDLAAPHHHEDEERHVFPLLLAHAPSAAVRQAVATLQADHARMTAQWAALRPRLLAWQQEGAAPLTEAERTQVRDFAALYASHIPLEETVAYPAARALLDTPPLTGAQADMGAEMAARRRNG
ncbi:hemerythrin domain-containing protein [Comamonadaceae bacterium OH2545_COT-014]|nr:hemerythrin domain-containing protein [Comamonadaceae bacterium OH2545_COT-014]